MRNIFVFNYILIFYNVEKKILIEKPVINLLQLITCNNIVHVILLA